MADRRSPSPPPDGHRRRIRFTPVVAVVLLALSASACSRTPTYPAGAAPGHRFTMAVNPATLRPGQPFIVTTAAHAGDPPPSEWQRDPVITWQVERDGRWSERYVLTSASRNRPPAVLPGNKRVAIDAAPLRSVGSATYQAPETVAGSYRVCATFHRIGSPAAAAPSLEVSCAPIAVARPIGSTT